MDVLALVLMVAMGAGAVVAGLALCAVFFILFRIILALTF